MPEVTITIGTDGQATVEADGIAGPGCSALTAAIEAAIGKTVRDQKKIEYSMAKQANNQQQKVGQ